MSSICQFCNFNNDLEEDCTLSYFKLKPIPPVDFFQDNEEIAKQIPLYDLAIYKCKQCGLIQIENSPPANIFYDDYIYSSSSSPDMKSNFIDLSESISNLFNATTNAQIKILDIGCNDGLLLEQIHRVVPNAKLYGTDPSPVAQKNTAIFYELHHEYFPGEKTIQNGLYDLISTYP